MTPYTLSTSYKSTRFKQWTAISQSVVPERRFDALFPIVHWQAVNSLWLTLGQVHSWAFSPSELHPLPVSLKLCKCIYLQFKSPLKHVYYLLQENLYLSFIHLLYKFTQITLAGLIVFILKKCTKSLLGPTCISINQRVLLNNSYFLLLTQKRKLKTKSKYLRHTVNQSSWSSL